MLTAATVGAYLEQKGLLAPGGQIEVTDARRRRLERRPRRSRRRRAGRREAGAAAASRRGRVAGEARAGDHRGRGAELWRGRSRPDASLRCSTPTRMRARSRSRRRPRAGGPGRTAFSPARPTRRWRAGSGSCSAPGTRATFRDERLARTFDDLEAFDQLRVDPYYRTVARRLPETAEAVGAFVRRMEATARLPRPRRLLAQERARRRRGLGDRLRGRPLRRPGLRPRLHAEPPPPQAVARPAGGRAARGVRARVLRRVSRGGAARPRAGGRLRPRARRLPDGRARRRQVARRVPPPGGARARPCARHASCCSGLRPTLDAGSRRGRNAPSP